MPGWVRPRLANRRGGGLSRLGLVWPQGLVLAVRADAKEGGPKPTLPKLTAYFSQPLLHLALKLLPRSPCRSTVLAIAGISYFIRVPPA